jgi:hypothetical protein
MTSRSSGKWLLLSTISYSGWIRITPEDRSLDRCSSSQEVVAGNSHTCGLGTDVLGYYSALHRLSYPTMKAASGSAQDRFTSRAIG